MCTETNASVTTPPAVSLPVEYIYIDGHHLALRQSVLRWATASEVNNKGFDIMKSIDGKKWTHVATVDGKGTVSEKTLYEWIDEHFFTTCFYKLMQVDFDNTIHESPIIKVNADKDLNGLTISSHYDMQSKQLYINESNASNDGVLDITVFNAMGMPLYTSDDHTLSSGQKTIDLSHLPTGMYFVQLRQGVLSHNFQIAIL